MTRCEELSHLESFLFIHDTHLPFHSSPDMEVRSSQFSVTTAFPHIFVCKASAILSRRSGNASQWELANGAQTLELTEKEAGTSRTFRGRGARAGAFTSTSRLELTESSSRTRGGTRAQTGGLQRGQVDVRADYHLRLAVWKHLGGNLFTSHSPSQSSV